MVVIVTEACTPRYNNQWIMSTHFALGIPSPKINNKLHSNCLLSDFTHLFSSTNRTKTDSEKVIAQIINGGKKMNIRVKKKKKMDFDIRKVSRWRNELIQPKKMVIFGNTGNRLFETCSIRIRLYVHSSKMCSIGCLIFWKFRRIR